ncbi:MAG: glycerate kinase [Anaerosolibacter sp.]|jgi:glycerate kinase|uniref:glycerate kinase n=1 Tax=Anaerosolibacter sp. TaxID=1872527 RepID=UPI00260AA5A0|nr:glycerate kinase [Anaerosolibacter sp.]MDF2547863.1 glycerate kinase [Anaerosolibacter sp.]
MKIVIAPDSYKGALSSREIANAIEAGGKKASGCIDIIKVPMADGGEGTVEAMVEATGGSLVYVDVTGPLGDKIHSYYGILGDGETAVIEMAAASGLPLVPMEKRNPLYTTTYGTGELIRHAIENGCKKLIIGIGGSATNDGGMGMAQALGIRFLDKYGNVLGFGGKVLEEIQEIDMSNRIPFIKNTEILVACDVTNPLCGPRGASYVFGPQKGATPQIVEQLDKGLENFSSVIFEQLNVAIKDLPGAGAAGGLGGGLVAFLGAALESGIQIMIRASRLEEKIKEADLVITGEGKTDEQTLFGKVPFGVAQIAKKYDVPVICLSGALSDGSEKLYDHGVTALFSVVNRDMSLAEAMNNTYELVKSASENILRLYVKSSNSF